MCASPVKLNRADDEDERDTIDHGIHRQYVKSVVKAKKATTREVMRDLLTLLAHGMAERPKHDKWGSRTTHQHRPVDAPQFPCPGKFCGKNHADDQDGIVMAGNHGRAATRQTDQRQSSTAASAGIAVED